MFYLLPKTVSPKRYHHFSCFFEKKAIMVVWQSTNFVSHKFLGFITIITECRQAKTFLKKS